MLTIFPEVFVMSRNIFNPDSGLMILMGQITDCIFLSMFWLLGCFPIVTVGPTTAALYDAVARSLRKGEKHSWNKFWQSFKRNLISGILPGLFVLAVGGGTGWLLIQVWNAAVAGSISWMLFSAVALVGVLVLGTLSLVMPVMSRFENSFGWLLRNSFLLGLANAPRTILLGSVNAVIIYLCARFVVPLFFLPCLGNLFGSVLIEPMLLPFMVETE